jgi:hypothetical protein
MKLNQPRMKTWAMDEFHVLMGDMRSNVEDHIIIGKNNTTRISLSYVCIII